MSKVRTLFGLHALGQVRQSSLELRRLLENSDHERVINTGSFVLMPVHLLLLVKIMPDTAYIRYVWLAKNKMRIFYFLVQIFLSILCFLVFLLDLTLRQVMDFSITTESKY